MRHDLLLLLGMVALAACGGEDEPKAADHPVAAMAPAKVDADVAALVPTDAACVVRASSAARLAQVAAVLQRDAGMGVPPDPVAVLARMMQLDPTAVDPARPLFLCVTQVDSTAPPLLTLLAPVKDPAAVGAAHPGAAVAGDYVSLSAGSPPLAGGSKLAATLPDGDVSLRADVARVVAMHRADIEEGLGFFRMGFEQGARASSAAMDPRAMVDAMVGWIRKVIDGAETLDVALNEKDGRFDVQLALAAREGSALAAGTPEKSRLGELARYLPRGMPIALLVRYDVEGMTRLFLPMMAGLEEKLPPESREGFKEYMERSIEMSKSLGDEAAGSFDFGASGFRMAMAMRASDAAGYVAGYRDLMTVPALGQMGMAFRSEGTRDVAGTTVQRLRMDFDFQKYAAFVGMEDMPPEAAAAVKAMFGEGGVLYEMAARDGRILTAVGGGDLMADLLSAAEPPAWFGTATAGIRGELTFLCRIELRSLLRNMAGLMTKIAARELFRVAEGGEVPILLWASADGRLYRAGATFHPGEIGTIIEH